MSSTKFVARHGINSLGDLIVTGSITATGGISISGSVTSASFATSASQAQNATSSSFAVTALTASYANNFTVAGTLTSQTLVVQTITSSVIYSSGSNIFGNDLANTQVLTGSVTVTGSLAVNNSNVILTNQTSSMSVATASFAISASQAQNAISSSYALTASFAANVPETSSFAISASQAQNAVSSSFALTASYASNVPLTASFAISASQAQDTVSSSFALTASYAENAGGGAGFPFSGSAVITGSLQITNLTGSGVRYVVTDSDGNVTAQQASASILSTQTVTASAGQTSFNITNGYTTGLVNVFVNGTKLNNSEYVDTNGTSITFLTASMSNDIVEFQRYFPASGVTNNALRSVNYFTAVASQSVFSASYTPGLLDVFYNGSKLSNTDYTANNGSAITLATASAAGDIIEIDVYSYQVGAFSGIGGEGTSGQISYFNTSNAITGSPNFTISGSTMTVTGSLLVSGSGTFTNIGPAVFSGSIVSTGGFTGSFSGTATNAVSASQAQDAVSASFALTAISASQAQNAVSSSFASFAANADLLDGKDSTEFAITGSNIFTGIQYNTDNSNPNGFGASASIYTDGGVRITRDAYVSGTMFVNNLTVFGTQSINYITSSQLNISTNIISVNTDTPSIRFGGLSVYDSGSTGLTGSMLWDSERDHWVYSNPSGSSYSGGMIMSGPRSAALGSEQGTLNNYVMKGQGGDHITSSQIIDDGTTVRIPGNFQVTGSVVTTGTAAFSNSVTMAYSGTPRLTLQDTDAGSGNVGILFKESTSDKWTLASVGGAFQFFNEATANNALYITSTNNVGIGTTNPSTVLHVSGSSSRVALITTSGALSSGFYDAFQILAANQTGGGLSLNIGKAESTNDLAKMVYFHVANGSTSNRLGFGFYANDALFNVLASGNVGIGTTVPNARLDLGPSYGASGEKFLIYNDNTSSALAGTKVGFYMDRFSLSNNSTFVFPTAAGAPGSFIIASKDTGGTTLVARMTVLGESGNVGIGTTSPGGILTIRSGVTNDVSSPESQVTITNTTSGNYATLGFRSVDSDGDHGRAGITVSKDAGSISGAMNFIVRKDAGTNLQAMRLNASGYLFINTTTNPLPPNAVPQLGILAGAGTDAVNIKHIVNGNNCVNIWQTGASAFGAIAFYKGDSQNAVGNINCSTSATVYNTSSDYRLKENIVPLSNGLDRLMQLKPSKFNWIETGEETEGFIAHELQEIFPYAVTGEKDAVYSSTGNIKPQSVDYGRITPLLVKAIQELKAENDTLKEILQRNNII